MSIKRFLSSPFSPKEMFGRRLEYYRSALAPLHAAISTYPLAAAYLSGSNVTHLGKPVLGSSIEIGPFSLSELDFCRLFMIFNGSNSSEFENLKVTKLGAPRGLYVISGVPGLTIKPVRVAIFRDGLWDFSGKSLYMDHLMLNKNSSPPLLGTIAVTLSLLTAYKVGIASVKLLAAGGCDHYHHYRNRTEYYGYLVCPKFGFDAPLSLKERRSSQLKGYKSVQDVVKQDPELWANVGFQRFMSFDLEPNSQSWNILLTYLKKKGF